MFHQNNQSRKFPCGIATKTQKQRKAIKTN